MEGRESIRGRLLALALGAVLPLVVLGLTILWVLWGVKEQQVNESLEQQAELAAVVFDRWIEAQRQALATIASYSPGHLTDAAALEAGLRAEMAPRPSWIDVRILDAGRRVLAVLPSDAETLPPGLVEKLSTEAQEGKSAISTSCHI